MATCCSYKTFEDTVLLSGRSPDLFDMYRKVWAEHSRHLKQLLGVWSGLHGAEWYIEARVEEHH
jgi:hypothetical protein